MFSTTKNDIHFVLSNAKKKDPNNLYRTSFDSKFTQLHLFAAKLSKNTAIAKKIAENNRDKPFLYLSDNKHLENVFAVNIRTSLLDLNKLIKKIEFFYILQTKIISLNIYLYRT